MAGILPIPTSRVTDYMSRQRLMRQVQSDQLDIFRLQNQISTGRRIFLGSEDPVAALRAITLQRTADRKAQVAAGLENARLSLSTTEGSLQEVSVVLNEVSVAAKGAFNTVDSEEARNTAINAVDGALFALQGTANLRLSGSYLFSGSRTTTQPYSEGIGPNRRYIEYAGNEANLRSYVDSDILYEVNLPGSEVFGGLSEAVRGTSDLNPQATGDTKLSSLRGGDGIGENGSLQLTFYPTSGATTSTVVDLSDAHTLNDVARLIEERGPAGANILVEVGGGGLRIRTTNGQLAITEVAEGRTAAELGILTSGASSSTITGSNLNPQLLRTTPIADLVGARATGRLALPGGDNDLVITAETNGAALNGVTVEFVAGTSLGATYSISGTPTLTVTFIPGETTATDVADLVNADGAIPFQLATHPGDASSALAQGTGEIAAGSFASATFGGANGSLDIASGLVIKNGGAAVTVDTSGVETVEQLLNRLNRPEFGLVATINDSHTGIDVRTKRSGADFSIGENGGTTAADLGIRTYKLSDSLADLNRGVGVLEIDGDDFTITTANSSGFNVDLAGVTTIGDVIERINTTPSNSGLVTARLAATGNGIELIDNTSGSANLTLTKFDESPAAENLGFISGDQASVSGAGRLQSADNLTYEVDSVFNSLMRLRTALQDNNAPEIGRAIIRIEADIDRVTFARAEVGAKLKTLDTIDYRLKEEDVQLKQALSETIDVDLAEAISNYTARQFALQASLQVTANLLQVSLLNYL
jgi:flagellin-like hook-associated protein FlgL